tara:strand:+ start:416 stop:1402 length:987 start_codon:yes stop_codon:yes gene_type:complete
MANVIELSPSRNQRLETLNALGSHADLQLPHFVESPCNFELNGKIFQSSDRKIIVNAKSGQDVNVVKKGYKLSKQSDALEANDEGIITQSQFPYHEGLQTVERLLVESSFDLTDVSRTIKTSDNGGKFIASYTLPAHNIDLGNGDITNMEVNFYNSTDGSWSWTLFIGGHRMMCANGMLMIDPITLYRSRHTPQLNPEHAKAKTAEAINKFLVEGEKWANWKKDRITDRQAIKLIADVLSLKIPNDEDPFIFKDSKKALANQSFQNLCNQWVEEKNTLGDNKWALFNALTHWSTHGQVRKEGTLIETRDRREQSIIKTLNKHQWSKAA